MISHKCIELVVAAEIDFDLPDEVNCNGANIDEIEIVSGVPYLIINLWEYATPIRFCPFCGNDFREE